MKSFEDRTVARSYHTLSSQTRTTKAALISFQQLAGSSPSPVPAISSAGELALDLYCRH